MLDIIVWYLLIALAGIFVLPLCFHIFPHLPDKGITYSKPLGLLLTSIVVWILCCFKLLPFNQTTCFLVLAFLGLANLIILLKSRKLREMLREWFSVKLNWWLLLTGEALFLSGYSFLLNARSFFPDLSGDEKFFDLSFINAIVASPSLPPPDPWYQGQHMHYYYGGQLMTAVMTKMSSTQTSTAYNIALALFFALAVITGFGLVTNLVRKAGEKKSCTCLSAGLLGVIFLLVLGNLYPLRQLLDGQLLPIGNPNFPLQVDWVKSARMIWDWVPQQQHSSMILSETPIYSFLMGDLHAHMMDLPFVMMTISFGLNLLGAREKWVLVRPTLGFLTLGKFLTAGFLVGALAFINGLDFLIYLFFVVLAIGLGEIILREEQSWQPIVGRWAVQSIGIVISTGLVYAFYFIEVLSKSNSKAASPGGADAHRFWEKFIRLVPADRTRLSDFLTQFGLLLIPILTFFLLRLIQLSKAEEVGKIKQLSMMTLLAVRLTGLVMLILAVYIFCLNISTVTNNNVKLDTIIIPLALVVGSGWLLWPGGIQALRRYPRLTLEGLTALLLFTIGPFLSFELLGLALILLYLPLRLLQKEWPVIINAELRTTQTTTDFFVLIATTIAGALVLFCEIFYLPDYYDSRAFGMWKFWYQVWILYGMSALYFLWRISRLKWSNELVEQQQSKSFTLTPTSYWTYISRVTKVGKKSLVILLVVLMIPASATATLGYWQRANHYTDRVGLSGEGWYARQFPSEYPAMAWLRQYTRIDPARYGIVLEANGFNYTWANRVSTFTGLPTIVGWPYHELQWRSYLDPLQIWQPWLDMDQIYKTTDKATALALLNKYNVRYVFVGQVENGTRSFTPDGQAPKNYSIEALSKFKDLMKIIYSDPVNNIYIYSR